jgi:hypothetical protein
MADQSEHHSGNLYRRLCRDKQDGDQENRGVKQSEKFLIEMGAPKVHHPRMIAGDFEVSRRSSQPEPYLTKSEVRLRVAKTEGNNDKQSLRRIPETPECAGFKYQGTTLVGP